MAMETLVQSDEFQSYLQQLRQNVDMPDNHMAKFILQVMDMIEILFLNIDSLRSKNWNQFTDSLRLMIPWMLLYDNTNYARWLPVYWLDMVTLPESYLQYMPDIFSQSMTGNAYSAIPPDLWIECTMNKNSKLKAGWKRLLKDDKGLMVHIKNMHNVSLVKNTLMDFVGQLKRKNVHRENTKSRIALDEKGVQDIISLLREWNANPFDRSQQELRTLMSGQLAGEGLKRDLEYACEDGEKFAKELFEQRFFSDAKSLFDNINRKEMKSFEDPLDKGKDTSKKESMEKELAIKLVNLCDQEDHPIFNYRITEECLSNFNANGTIRKNQKPKLKDVLSFVEINPKDYIAIIDAGFFWRLCTPKSNEYEKNDGTRLTWQDYALKVFQTILSRHPNAQRFIVVNDYYGSDVANCKDGESSQRKKQFTGGESPNVFPARTKELPLIRLFQDFFKNNGNKQRLQSFLKEEFHRLCMERGVTMIYCTRKESLCLSYPVMRETQV